MHMTRGWQDAYWLLLACMGLEGWGVVRVTNPPSVGLSTVLLVPDLWLGRLPDVDICVGTGR